MSTPASFLTALGRGIAALHLYPSGHPSRTDALDEAFAALNALLRGNPNPSFTFLDTAVLFGNRPLAGVKRWVGADRLIAAGMQRVEFEWPVPLTEFLAFLEEAAGIAEIAATDSAERHPRIRFGAAVLPDDLPDPVLDAHRLNEIEQSLGPEMEAMAFVMQEAGAERGIQRLEVESIVSSLLVSVASGGAFLVPLLRLRDADQYTTAHSLNVAALSMALADYAGYAPDQIRAIGIAGVLHDIGKVRVPREVLTKAGPLSAEERALMNLHPVDGARIILQTGGPDLDLAAIVAYEHHIRFDGGGYPTPRRPRSCHPASDLLHVCDVFDALATHRPYRAAWPTDRILAFIAENAGTEFEPQSARALLGLMRDAHARFRVQHEDSTAAAGA